MNTKNAAGRNWARTPRRLSRVHQCAPRPAVPDTERAGISQLRPIKDAPGRNWDHPVHRHPTVTLRSAASSAPQYPERERGGGDHDQPYTYRRPTTLNPFPFTLREYARLLILQSRLGDHRLSQRGRPATSSTTSSAEAASR